MAGSRKDTCSPLYLPAKLANLLDQRRVKVCWSCFTCWAGEPGDICIEKRTFSGRRFVVVVIRHRLAWRLFATHNNERPATTNKVRDSSNLLPGELAPLADVGEQFELARLQPTDLANSNRSSRFFRFSVTVPVVAVQCFNSALLTTLCSGENIHPNCDTTPQQASS